MSNGETTGNGVTWKNRLWGELSVKGRDVIMILAALGLAGILYAEGQDARQRQQEIMCLLRLQIWTSIAREENFTLRHLPMEYWNCLPEVLIKYK